MGFLSSHSYNESIWLSTIWMNAKMIVFVDDFLFRRKVRPDPLNILQLVRGVCFGAHLLPHLSLYFVLAAYLFLFATSTCIFFPPFRVQVGPFV